MKVAVTSQNFKHITGHAGKSRRFLIFDATVPCDPEEVGRLDLPMGMAFHDFAGGTHPLDDMDVILTASAGQGFIDRLAKRGVKVIVCGETNPRTAVRDLFMGLVKPGLPHVHEHEHAAPHEKGHSCCSGQGQKC